jgi:conjugative transfer signal peptidase TraF
MKKKAVVGAALVGLSALLFARGEAGSLTWWNDSPSMPRGLYVRMWGEVARGDVVLACVPPKSASWALAKHVLGKGNCDGAVPVIKRAFGLPGDRVQISSQGITVNGKPIYDTKRRSSNIGPIPSVDVDRVLGPGEFVLVGDDRPGSWDSRYWGPTNHVLGRVVFI